MLRRIHFSVVVIFFFNSLFCCAQQETATAPRFAIAFKVSLLGFGGEAAVPITRKTDFRAGVNGFSYDRNFNKDGVGYAGHLNFRSTETHFDWFPFGGSFHLSPGMLIYNGNKITADASVTGGQTFDLNGKTSLLILICSACTLLWNVGSVVMFVQFRPLESHAPPVKLRATRGAL